MQSGRLMDGSRVQQTQAISVRKTPTLTIHSIDRTAQICNQWATYKFIAIWQGGK